MGGAAQCPFAYTPNHHPEPHPCSTSIPPTTPPPHGATSSSTSPLSSSVCLSQSALSKLSSGSIIAINSTNSKLNSTPKVFATFTSLSATSSSPSSAANPTPTSMP